MKTIIICISLVLCLAGTSAAQHKITSDTLANQVRKTILRAQAERVKPYYNNIETAELCERWNSCAKWASEQYAKDPAFKILKAQHKNRRMVQRHRFFYKPQLYVQAVLQGKTVNLLFTSTVVRKRTSSYQIVTKFPEK